LNHVKVAPTFVEINAVRIFENFESNSYFSIRFDSSTIIPNFQILTVTNFLLI